MRAKGYSLWLMPQGNKYQLVSNVINDLAIKYNSPVFEPHVTLIGEVSGDEHEIVEKTEEFASHTAAFTIQLENIDIQDYFFRALFIKAKASRELLNLHKNAKQIFSMQNIPEYMPHVSLLYGNVSLEEKEKIIQSITVPFTEFTVETIHLYRTKGEVNSWYKIYEFPFQSE